MNSRKLLSEGGKIKEHQEQQKLFEFLKNSESQYSEASAKYRDKLDALIQLFAKTTLPTTLLDSEVFYNFCNAMDSQFKLLCTYNTWIKLS